MGTFPATGSQSSRLWHCLMSSMNQRDYVPFVGAENMNRYCEGGLSPIYIEDIFDNRYRVINKLGYRARSTVTFCFSQSAFI
ncbi:hypothetical protein BDQ17DRAFT_1351411 [Cyathus striatus]|nr:hypothetical protein BDQ17DRAFT_1351411 [Cyathus striatus]